jgi:hypothetical protein
MSQTVHPAASIPARLKGQSADHFAAWSRTKVAAARPPMAGTSAGAVGVG